MPKIAKNDLPPQTFLQKAPLWVIVDAYVRHFQLDRAKNVGSGDWQYNGYKEKKTKLGILVPPDHNPQRTRITPLPVDSEGRTYNFNPNCFS